MNGLRTNPRTRKKATPGQCVAGAAMVLPSARKSRRRRIFAEACSRRGYTLIEVVASVAATSILLAGMGSVVMVAARSTDEDALPMRQIEASLSLQEILADLEYAVSFSERTATAVAFTVADRNADTTAETIRYTWSGTPGDPLRRKYNGGTEVDYLSSVHVFEYSDRVKAATSYDGTETHHVRQCSLVLQIGDDAAARTIGSVMTRNAPEVAAP